MQTNCYDIAQVNAALQGRLGWLQPTMAGMPMLNGTNTGSTTGRYYNDGSFHEALTIERLYNLQEDKAITPDNFNTYLQQQDKSCIARCMGAVFNRSQLVDNGMTYTRQWSNVQVPIQNGKNFCGYQIIVAKGDYIVNINSLALNFTGDVTFNLYIFNDNFLAPIKTISVSAQANNQVVIPINTSLNNVSATNKGGVFYIGYFQNDIGDVQAIDEQYGIWNTYKLFQCLPFQSAQTGTDLNFNRSNANVVFRNYGLNLDMSSARDYTRTITENGYMFDEARGLTMAIYCFGLMKSSLRINDVERKGEYSASDINLETSLAFPTKDFPFVSGLKARLDREFKRLNDNFYPKAKAMSMSIGKSQAGEYYQGYDISNLPPRENAY